MPLSVVIPALDEERTVAGVVEAARKARPLVREVIVVSDGSRDSTAAVAANAGARVLALPRNLGKTRALLAGVESAQEGTLLFLDADLLGLSEAHIHRLAEPVISGRAAMSIGVFRDARPVTDLAQFLAPALSGQRVLSRELFLTAAGNKVEGFAVEVALNSYAHRYRLPVAHVPLTGVTHLTKEEKRGLWPGFAARMRMYLDIWKANA